MNAARRKRAGQLHDRVLELLQEAEALLTEEQDAFDSLPEPIQEGARGEKIGRALEVLEAVVDSLDNAHAELGGIE